MPIDFSQRMLLGHKDVTWKVGLYFGQGIGKYNPAKTDGTVVGLRTYDAKQRERVLLACKLVKDIVQSAIDKILKYGPSHTGKITPRMVLTNLAMERKTMTLRQEAKKLFDETSLAVPPNLMKMIFWTGAESSKPLADLIRFHVIWTAIGLLGHRINMAPYVVSSTGRVTMPLDAQYVYELYGNVPAFPITAPYDAETWYSMSLISHAHRELYHFENPKHGVKDIEQGFGEELIHVNSRMLSKEGGYWLLQTAWTIIHEYTHLLSGTTDAVGACPEIYFRAYDRNGKAYYFKDGEVKENLLKPDAKRLRFHDGAMQVGTTPKYNAYRTSKAVTHLPADTLTCLLFTCSNAFSGAYEGATKLF